MIGCCFVTEKYSQYKGPHKNRKDPSIYRYVFNVLPNRKDLYYENMFNCCHIGFICFLFPTFCRIFPTSKAAGCGYLLQPWPLGPCWVVPGAGRRRTTCAFDVDRSSADIGILPTRHQASNDAGAPELSAPCRRVCQLREGFNIGGFVVDLCASGVFSCFCFQSYSFRLTRFGKRLIQRNLRIL